MYNTAKNRILAVFLAILLAVFLVSGCDKRAELTAQPAELTAAPELIPGPLGGLSVEIADAYTGSRLQGASVKIGPVVTMTGVDGIVTLEDRVCGDVSLAVSKPGYQSYSGQVEIVAGEHSFAAIELLSDKVTAVKADGTAFLEISPYALSERGAFIVYKTFSPISGAMVFFGRDPDELDNLAANGELGIVNSAMCMFLEPGRVYYYQIRCRDTAGRLLVSPVKSFCLPQDNYALGRTASGSFDRLPPDDPYVNREKAVLPRVVDGLTGYFEGMATSGSVNDQDQQVTIDLGEVRPLRSLLSYWRALAYPQSFTVRLSDDNLNWREVAVGIDAGQGAFARSDAGDPMRVVNTVLNGLSARYLQVLVQKGSCYYVKHDDWDFVQLMELEVF